jgi:hypothetical protein
MDICAGTAVGAWGNEGMVGKAGGVMGVNIPQAITSRGSPITRKSNFGLCVFINFPLIFYR